MHHVVKLSLLPSASCLSL